MTRQTRSPDSPGASSFDPYSPDGAIESLARSLSRDSPFLDHQRQAHDSNEMPLSNATDADHSPTRKNVSRLTEDLLDRGSTERQLGKRKRTAVDNQLALPNGSSGPKDSDGGNIADNQAQYLAGHSSNERTKRVKFNGNHSDHSDIPLDDLKLPGEIWQHIFTFLPPASLGRVLQVNRFFRDLLTADLSELSAKSTTQGLLKYVHSNHIWSLSRKIYHPGMPRPLATLSELDMWRLIRGTACQFCSKAGFISSPDRSIWEAGPGSNGVRIIWPFAVRACGECLQHNCDKVSRIQTTIFPLILTLFALGNGPSIFFHAAHHPGSCYFFCIFHICDAFCLLSRTSVKPASIRFNPDQVLFKVTC